MGATFSRLKQWSTGETLTASDLNAEFNQIYNNLDPSGIDDESANDAAAQATSDPYPGSSLSKATSLQGEIQQLRYLIAQITGETYWYIDPDNNIATLAANLIAPSGTIMLFGQNSAPTGWTRKTDWQDNAMLCYAASGDIGSGGSVNPQSTHTHGPGSLKFKTGEQAGSHPRTLKMYDTDGTARDVVGNQYAAGSAGEYEARCLPSDSYTYYTKDGSGVTGANSAPYFQEVIAAQKD